MDDTDHVEILNQGVDTWNLWRKENPNKRPNLSEAILHETDLSGAFLRRADLSDAFLMGADFSGANLTRANLRGANLHETILCQADLSEADLQWANLRLADLSEADLCEANLSGADLSDSVIHDAFLSEANLEGANLSGANLWGSEFVRADLTKTDLSGASLSKADLSDTKLREADLSGASLFEAFLIRADLSRANLSGADLYGADFSHANLSEADLSETDLRRTNLSAANLSQTDVSGANLVSTNLEKANLSGCRIYGISAWDLNLIDTVQRDLVITPWYQPVITVDDLRMAQFLYLLLDNRHIRDALDTITSKAVLILGRFTQERKAVLDAIRDELRQRDYLPILFDFEKPIGRDLTETISTLAHLSRFIIADVTDAKSIPQELQTIVPNLPSVPVRLLVQRGAREYALIGHFKRLPWVSETYQYDDTPQLLASLSKQVIEPAEKKVEELREK